MKTLAVLALLCAVPAAATDLPPPAAQDPAAEALRKASVDEILARARASLPKLGSYKLKLKTAERIGGKMRDPQLVQLWVRQQPLALRLEFIEGKGKGRRVLYDTAVRSDDLRVRETGFRGIVGAIWIGIHNSLVFGDTNHPITDVGVGAMMHLIGENVVKAQAFGGFTRTDLGLNERGRYCLQFDAPPKATGLYARRTKLCLDPVSWLPMENSNWDEKGLMEAFVFTDVEPHGAEAGDPFTLKAAGL
jgi:hypothetical protein